MKGRLHAGSARKRGFLNSSLSGAVEDHDQEFRNVGDRTGVSVPSFGSARAFGIAACAGVAGLACFWLWLADDEETRIAYSRDRQTHRPTPSAAHQRRLNASDPVPSRFYDADEEKAQRVVKSWIDPDWLKSAVDPAIYGTYDMARHPIDGPCGSEPSG